MVGQGCLRIREADAPVRTLLLMRSRHRGFCMCIKLRIFSCTWGTLVCSAESRRGGMTTMLSVQGHRPEGSAPRKSSLNAF